MKIAEADPSRRRPPVCERRRAVRSRVDDTCTVVLACFSTNGPQRFFTGTLKDCAEGGLQIESDRGFNPGTILMIRMMQCPFHRLAPEVNEMLRTVLLAEVKWLNSPSEAWSSRCCMGVRYL